MRIGCRPLSEKPLSLSARWEEDEELETHTEREDMRNGKEEGK
jgi:hypothetical protein